MNMYGLCKPELMFGFERIFHWFRRIILVILLSTMLHPPRKTATSIISPGLLRCDPPTLQPSYMYEYWLTRVGLSRASKYCPFRGIQPGVSAGRPHHSSLEYSRWMITGGKGECRWSVRQNCEIVFAKLKCDFRKRWSSTRRWEFTRADKQVVIAASPDEKTCCPIYRT